MSPPLVLFVPLAGNQARFYLSVARVLAGQGLDARFFTFHEPTLDLLRGAGFPADSAFTGGAAPAMPDALETIARAGITDVNLAISHERAAYEIGNGVALVAKLARHLGASQAVLAGAAAGGRRVEVVQELGGFLSVLAVFHSARRLGLRTTFMEPSFFRGRLLFTHDTLAAPQPSAPPRDPTPDVRAYLDRALADKQIVIPDKDRAHYRPATRKIFNARNLRRLFEKTADKHVRRQHEEFDHLTGHVSRHLRMATTAARLKRHYRELPSTPFVYYPLHVPADVALTLRAPEYYDQLALLEYLARAVPPTHQLLVKEHPALVGAVDFRRVVHLLSRYDNVVLLRPTINNHDVLAAADVVVTVNSKSGAEALLRGRRVLVLGDSFYRDSGLARRVDRLADLPAAIAASLAAPGPDPIEIGRFFQRVWDTSRPGELYLDTPENVQTFAASLRGALGLDQPAGR